MKYLKKLNSLNTILLSICLIVMLLTITGCGGTMSETKAERERRHRQIVRTGLGQMADDWDAMWMMDRRSKLSDKLIRDY